MLDGICCVNQQGKAFSFRLINKWMTREKTSYLSKPTQTVDVLYMPLGAALF
jgi:hypothetical protein